MTTLTDCRFAVQKIIDIGQYLMTLFENFVAIQVYFERHYTKQGNVRKNLLRENFFLTSHLGVHDCFVIFRAVSICNLDCHGKDATLFVPALDTSTYLNLKSICVVLYML